MRPLGFLGIALIGLGAFLLGRGMTYRTQRSVLKVGDFEASVEEQRPLPVWIGGGAVAVGLVLALAGAGRRRDA
jgi:hypothetical protein